MSESSSLGYLNKMSEYKSKCCGTKVRDTIEWAGDDYKRTKEGEIEVKHFCIQCCKPTEVEEKEEE